MRSLNRFARRLAATLVMAASLAVAGVAGSAAVAPATASAVSMRVICQDVYMRVAPAGAPYNVFWNPLPYGTYLNWEEWPSTPGWVKVGIYGAHGYVDASCVTLA